jgi:hypothetical protein
MTSVQLKQQLLTNRIGSTHWGFEVTVLLQLPLSLKLAPTEINIYGLWLLRMVSMHTSR